jgi:hypothetical protein
MLCSREVEAWLTVGSGIAFGVLFVAALVVLFLGAAIEERVLWRGRLGSPEEVPRWIGKPRSSLLAATAPSPLSLGFALGLLSQVVA